MVSPLPDDIWSLIVLSGIIISLFLTVYLPWKRDYSCSMVLAGSILVISAVVFFLDLMEVENSIIRDLGFYPDDIVDNYSVHRFVTPIFLHGDFLHLISNFLPLFFLGMQLEGKIGWKRYLLLFIGSGIIAHAVVLILSPFEALGQRMDIVSIGASGAVFGLLGGYWFLYPKDEVFFPLILIRKWPISLIFMIYGGMETVLVFAGTNDHISHAAHLGGLLGAFPLAAMIRPDEDEGEAKPEEPWGERLEELARTRSQKESLHKALSADEPEVRDAWLEDFFDRIRCPKCGKKGMDYGGKTANCTKCGYRIRP